MATYVMGFKEMLIKARLSPAIATRSTASVASGAKAPATRGNLLKCGYSRSHNVSGAKAPATRGNLLECGYSRSHNVSGHTPCGCVRTHNMTIEIYCTCVCYAI